LLTSTNTAPGFTKHDATVCYAARPSALVEAAQLVLEQSFIYASLTLKLSLEDRHKELTSQNFFENNFRKVRSGQRKSQ
jgi:hypothetical protein